MKDFIVPAHILKAKGFQEFRVRAATPDGAIKIWENGGGKLEAQDIEVTKLMAPQARDVYEA